METFFKRKSTKREKDWNIIKSNNLHEEERSNNLNRSRGEYSINQSYFPEFTSTDIRQYEKVGRNL